MADFDKEYSKFILLQKEKENIKEDKNYSLTNLTNLLTFSDFVRPYLSIYCQMMFQIKAM